MKLLDTLRCANIVAMSIGILGCASTQQIELKAEMRSLTMARVEQIFDDTVAEFEERYNVDLDTPRVRYGKYCHATSGAEYNHRKNTIIICRPLPFRTDNILGRKVPTDMIAKEGEDSLEDYLRHELGHAYHHSAVRELKTRGLNPQKSNDKPNISATWEGIGEFVTYGFNPSIKTECDLPRRIEDYDIALPGELPPLYTCGFVLVEPILEELGFKEGVEWISLNPPTDEELLSPEMYHNRALPNKVADL